ncbi:MAG: hypothetical protein JRJ84_21085, partial [Deltaproteobacteria bacterium]|nr:hypothetical protein [Deltaproteobacteria bacterium]
KVTDSLRAAAPFIRSELEGEAILTLGGPLHEWREGLIDGTISVGPLECMPSKIAEAQLFHVAQTDGLVSLSLPLNGDPVDSEVLDGFAWEVKEAHRRRGGGPVRTETEPSGWRWLAKPMKWTGLRALLWL